MGPLFSPFLFIRLAGQLLALFVLYIALQWLLPILAATIFEGMRAWRNVAIVYCWLIQYAFIAVTVELRETLTGKAAHWLTLLPRQYLRLVLGLANLLAVLVMLSAIWILVKTITAFSFAVAIELLLLLVQVWCLCGAAVPMSAKKFYVYFFKQPQPVHENWILGKQQKGLI